MIRTLATKGLVVVLMVAMLGPFAPVSVPKAEAQFATVSEVFLITDPGLVAFEAYMTGAKQTEVTWETVLKGIGWAVAKTAIKSMTRSIVEWINSGFNGSPAFTQNLNRDLRRLADGVAVAFVQDLLSESGAIESPFLQQAVQGTVTGYLLYTSREAIARRLAFTLHDYTTDYQAWQQGDFSQGGWSAWFASVRYCGNTVDCARFATEEELINRIDGELRQRLEELDWGQGFLSWRGECLSSPEEQASLGDAEKCYKYEVQTPGSVVENALGITVTSPLRQLEIADSIDEIVGALVTQLVTQVVGSTGLFGVSQPSQGGGRSLLNQATDTSGAANPALTSGFDEAIAGNRRTAERYKEAWEEIRSEAAAALAVCEPRSNKEEEEARLREIIEEAESAIARANAALAELDGLEERIEEVRSDTDDESDTSSSSVESISNDYQCLLNGGVPSPGTDGACLRTEDGRPLLPGETDAVEAERQASDQEETLMGEIGELEQECRRVI